MEEIKKNQESGLIKVDRNQFIEKYEPRQMLMQFREVNSIQKAIDCDGNGISYYSKHLGMDSVLAVIELHLISLNAAVNVNQHLNEYQIKEIAIEILSIHYHLNMVEIGLIFRKAKRGEYGKLYGVLNMVDILSWFSLYSEERAKLYIEKQMANRFKDDSMRSEDRKIWERHEKLINKNKGNE
tara:strand:+ start:116 stop:664 length:549 start_codon:yes stop_codon:yes gene_type:complete